MIKPPLKMYVHRLEQMINKIDEDGCEAFCPIEKRFKLKFENHKWQPLQKINGDEGDWCSICQYFMGIPHNCPCQYYKKKGQDPIEEALKRIQAYKDEPGKEKHD